MIENFKLHVFRVVADALNFSKAAEELHISQPAVTSQVRTLEEGLGIALFDRVGRNATLTPAGKTLLPFVRQIETLTSDAVAALAPFGVQEGVELNIGASHTIGVYLLPKLLPMVVREWPKLRIHIVSGSTTEILNALATHQVSIGLIEAPGRRPDLKIEQPYCAQHVPLGFGTMFGAGTLSGLLGIGSGAVKVLAMDQAMKLPFKVSTTTSNFMIGVTAAASAGIYLARGYIEPGIAMPVMLGVLIGSLIGSKLLVKARVATLKVVFGLVIVLLGAEMIYSGITGRI